MRLSSPLLICLSAVLFLSGCGAPNSSHTSNSNQQQASAPPDAFPANTEFVYLSAPQGGQVYGFRLDTTSGSLSPVPGSPIAGPSGMRGRMFLSRDERTLISVGEGTPSVKYSIN